MERTLSVLALALGGAACTHRTAVPDSPVMASASGSPATLSVAPEPREPRAVSVTGNLPTDIIVRIVRQANPQFRACYEQRPSAHAEGVVAARFTIVADGTVEGVGDAGSDFPDETVVRCILHVFEGLAYPQPGDGTVAVVYPLNLPLRAH